MIFCMAAIYLAHLDHREGFPAHQVVYLRWPDMSWRVSYYRSMR